MTTESVPVSVVVPTAGRVERLRACLDSLSQCRPGSLDVIVVDQSRSSAVASAVREFADVRLILCTGTGPGRGRNLGAREAAFDALLFTDDDCTVASSWIGTAWRLTGDDPDTLVTGRVLPSGDPEAIPSTIGDPDPRDYTGKLDPIVLYAGNMLVNRPRFTELGGFDERFLSAEDNDFCYRWLRSGKRIRYEPQLVVWHHDWRSREELERLYAAYGEGQGRFYAKHLRAGDLTMLRFLAGDLYAGVRTLARATVHGRRRRSDPARRIGRGIAQGLVKGWREFEA